MEVFCAVYTPKNHLVMANGMKLAPTTFTREFLDMDFSSYRYLLPSTPQDDHPSSSNLAMVPISGFDRGIIKLIDNHCRNKGSTLFCPNPEQFKDWCFLARSFGWDEMVVKYSSPLKIKTNTDLIDYHPDVTADATVIDLVQRLFPGWWPCLFSVKIRRLRAGGWANPHRDMFSGDFNLCNFWMPLHDFEKGLKVFPLGWLMHQVGTLYLFNQQRYPHAIINNTDQDRLVICGKFYQDQIPASLAAAFNDNKKHYLNYWI